MRKVIYVSRPAGLVIDVNQPTCLQVNNVTTGMYNTTINNNRRKDQPVRISKSRIGKSISYNYVRMHYLFVRSRTAAKLRLAFFNREIMLVNSYVQFCASN